MVIPYIIDMLQIYGFFLIYGADSSIFFFFMTIGNVFSMTVLRKGWDKWLLEPIAISKNTFFVSFFRGSRQFFHLFSPFVANSVLCLMHFGKNSPKTIAGDEN